MSSVHCLRACIAGSIAGLQLVACATGPSQDELEAAKNTVSCQYAGERLLIRFEPDEARLLMANGNRVTLYQIRTPSGLRYSNGLIELRGRDRFNLEVIRDDVDTLLVNCEKYTPPAK
jgi:hypothetical protein